MAQSVMITLTTMMLLLCADNWDSLLMVNIYLTHFHSGRLLLLNSGALALPTGFFGGVVDIVLGNLLCVGTEHSLLECVGNTTFTTCESLEDAAIICQGSIYVHMMLTITV